VRERDQFRPPTREERHGGGVLVAGSRIPLREELDG